MKFQNILKHNFDTFNSSYKIQDIFFKFIESIEKYIRKK